MITIANGWIPSAGMLPEMRRVWPTDMEVQDESNVNKIMAGLVKTLTSNEKTSTLGVSEIPTGLYVLYIQGSNKWFIKKVEVVR